MKIIFVCEVIMFQKSIN